MTFPFLFETETAFSRWARDLDSLATSGPTRHPATEQFPNYISYVIDWKKSVLVFWIIRDNSKSFYTAVFRKCCFNCDSGLDTIMISVDRPIFRIQFRASLRR